MKTLFLINSRSGTRKRYDLEAIIRETCTWEHELVPAESKEQLDDIVAGAARDGVDVVYAVGGDGTVHEVAKRLVGTPLALGILPTGSGNGFARHLGLPVEPRASLRACSARRIVTIDTADVDDTRFLGVMGVGLDAVIADRFAASTVRGLQTYIKVGLGTYFEHVPEVYEIDVDGMRTEERALVVAVANSGQYGNSARIAPHASVTDGLLDLVVVRERSLLGAATLIPRLFLGTLDRSRAVTTIRGRHIVIHRASGGPAHLDGEPVMMPAVLDVRVNAGSLKVLVPDTPGVI